MRIYIKKAPHRGEANSKNFDLFDDEIKTDSTTSQTFRQARPGPLRSRIRQLYARLPLALDDDKFPILAKHSGLPTKKQINRDIRRELVKLEVHYG